MADSDLSCQCFYSLRREICAGKISALAQINRVRSEETMRMFSLFCPVYEHVNFW